MSKIVTDAECRRRVHQVYPLEGYMREIVVRYINGPLQGLGAISVPDGAPEEPPLVQRIPLPGKERGVQQTMSRLVGEAQHAVYERTVLNPDSGEWEFQLVRIE